MAWMFALDERGAIKEYMGSEGELSIATMEFDLNGLVFDGWEIDPKTATKFKINSPPVVGAKIKVGKGCCSLSNQHDWWQTGTVTRIVNEFISQDGKKCVVFETSNNLYYWRE